jgi:hypothetical protein
MKKNNIRIILVTLFLLNVASVYADVLYSKPEFRGKVIDAETKQPIEGAVVVVLYYKMHLIGAPGGPSVLIMAAKETLTNNNGEFFLPSYSTLMLISKEIPIRFIFYKPEYISIKGAGLENAGISFEKYFSTGKVGEILEIEEGTFEQGSYVKWKGPMGIVELKKAKTREEKWKAPMVFTSSLGSNDLPLLYKAINEAEKNLKMEGIR